MVRKSSLFFLGVLAILCVTIYANSLSVPFQWDDYNDVLDNPAIRKIGYFFGTEDINIIRQSKHFRTFFYRPVGTFTFSLNYLAHGFWPPGFHLVNIFIHLLNALLVWYLILLTCCTPFMRYSKIEQYGNAIAFVAAALFASHPVQTQAVTLIVQRYTSLAAFFYIASLLLYVLWRLGQKNWIIYALSLACAVLGMLTKQNVFTLPLMIALYEILFFEGKVRDRLMPLVPFVATMVIIPLTIVLANTGEHASIELFNEVTMVQHVPRSTYLLTELRVIATYWRLLLLPMGQNLDYDCPVYNSLLGFPIIFSAFLHMGIVLLAVYFLWRSRRGERALRLVGFGICWFYLALSVESTLVPLFPIFEHRLYLPSVGAFFSISSAFYLLVRKRTRVLTIALSIAVIALCAATIARNHVWRSEISLWKDVVEKSPRKARPLIDLGIAYFEANEYKKAEAAFKKVLKIDPGDYSAYLNLGVVYEMTGSIDQAILNYYLALQVDPQGQQAHFNLGEYYFEQQDYEIAFYHLSRAAAIRPDDSNTRYLLGQVFLEKGNTAEARKEFEAALASNPDHVDAQRALKEIAGF